MRVGWMILVMLLLSSQALSQCVENQEDLAIIKEIVEHQIINDCNTILKLSGIFFADQQKPPNSVKVTYKLQFPYDSQCESVCPCWKTQCTDHCTPDHCCIERQFLWGRIPNYAQDSIFRDLTMCNLIVGGVKEKSITINLNVSSTSVSPSLSQCADNGSMPCSWCYDSAVLKGSVTRSSFGLDTLLSMSPRTTPMERALMSVTAKLQGYAAKLETIEWLQYSSELAFGYSAPYRAQFDSVARWVMFLLFYSSFQLLIFMLIYKYRYRIYNSVCQYVNQSPINQSLFWSFILTTILAFCCVLVLSLVADGICLSVLQVIMMIESLAFGVPHSLVSCFRMKKSRATIVNPQRYCLHKVVPSILLSYIYTLPHIAFYWAINVIVYTIAKPFSYIVLSVYFCVSCMFIWVANAIGIQLLFPLRPFYPCRRQIFAITFIIGCNALNFVTWGFIEVYFYDRRAQTTSIITILPGLVFTLLGYYLSGDLVKLFDILVGTLPVTNNNDQLPKVDIDTSTEQNGGYHDNDDSTSMTRSDSNSLLIGGEYSPRTTSSRAHTQRRTNHKLTRLRQVVGIIQRPTSVMDLGSWKDGSASTESHEGYLEIPHEDKNES